MRNHILAISAIMPVVLAATSAPIAAQAQSDTVGIVRGGGVVVDDDFGIAVDRRPAFREYIVRERVPSYTIPERVIIGGVLPETGVTYYDVPQSFGVTPYHRRERPDRAGRTTHTPHRSGDRITSNVPERIVRPKWLPDAKAPPGLPRPGGALVAVTVEINLHFEPRAGGSFFPTTR